jgi:hypothetical protein
MDHPDFAAEYKVNRSDNNKNKRRTNHCPLSRSLTGISSSGNLFGPDYSENNDGMLTSFSFCLFLLLHFFYLEVSTLFYALVNIEN